jgi:signal transduction histidine kinase
MTAGSPQAGPYSWKFVGPWLVITSSGGLLGAALARALGGHWLLGLALGLAAGNVAAIGLYLWRSQAPVAPPLPEVNVRLLRWVLRLVAGGTLAYLAAGWAGVPFNLLFPWDGLGLLALCALAAGLLRAGRSFWAASALLGGICIPIAFNAQYYGMASPVNALYVLGLLVSGLVTGSGGFLGMLAAISVLTVLFTIGEQQGMVSPVYPAGTPAESAGLVVFWLGLYAASAWLSWLFARTLEAAVHTARGQRLALAHTLNAITPEASLDAVLAQTLAAMAEQLRAARAELWLRDAASDTLRLRLARGPQGPLETGEQRPGGGAAMAAAELPLWQALAADTKPLAVEDVANDARVLGRAQALAWGTRTLLYVPLLAAGETAGFFSLHSAERRRFSAEDLELAQALAQQVTLTMQLARLAEQGRQGAILAERNRMAREIHDTLAQGFTGIVVQLEAAEDVLGEKDPAASAHLARARLLARQSLAEARRSVYALRLPEPEREPLPTALRRSIGALAAGTPLAVAWEVDEPWPALPDELEQDLLRIGQEAATNVLKHARASRLRVALRAAADEVRLEVSDDGQGIDPAANAHGGFGLLGMRERAARHGGALEVTSQPGKGTMVRCRLPRKAGEPVVRGEAAAKGPFW